jgi:hypothetical protein
VHANNNKTFIKVLNRADKNSTPVTIIIGITVMNEDVKFFDSTMS